MSAPGSTIALQVVLMLTYYTYLLTYLRVVPLLTRSRVQYRPMRGTASEVAGTISATIICSTLIDSRIVIAAMQTLYLGDRYTLTSLANNFLWSCCRRHRVRQLNDPPTQFSESRKDIWRLTFVNKLLSISVWQSTNYCHSITTHTNLPHNMAATDSSNFVISLDPMYIVGGGGYCLSSLFNVLKNISYCHSRNNGSYFYE